MARLDGPALVHRQTGQLTLIFDVEIHKKYGLLKPELANLDVSRTAPPSLKDIRGHMESQLKMNGSGGQLLLKAVCANMSGRNRHLQDTSSSPSAVARKRRKRLSQWKLTGAVPLVCQQIWSNVVLGYPEATLTILVDQHAPQVQVLTNSCLIRCFKRELKYLDIVTFLPTKSLKAKHIMGLCRDIFERGVKVKHELRRGVWLHLVGVFHPQLESREERERYMAKLRMVYDHLKGKIMGESSDLQEKEQLVDAVHRDAIRTDPSNPFFADYRQPEESYVSQHYHQTSDDSNIQKLINIIVIYTLEHGNISYTQGMTDILSPILYVMRNEADAYICFAAMVERIKQHFSQWCTGTLLKLERLRHLCEVLDPKLYACLSANIDEDVFALFFGMVLIECRREFSFEDSFHLLETIWAGVTCSRNSFPSFSPLSNAEWASYMTYESPEVLQQVFEESACPYSAIPLPHTMSGSYSYYAYSRNPSLIMSQSPPTTSAATFLRRQSEIEPPAIPEHPDSSTSPIPTPLSINRSNSSIDTQHHRPIVAYTNVVEQETSKESQSRARSQSDSNLKGMLTHKNLGSIRSPYHIGSASPRTLRGGVSGMALPHKLGNSSFSHSESELYDSFSNSKVTVQSKLRHPTEMSDMSSLSSGTTSANGGNFLSSMKSTRNGTPDSATGVSQARHHSRNSGSASMERGVKVSTSGVGSDASDSDSSGLSKFKDALPYLTSVGASELPEGILLEPDSSSLDGARSADTVVANKSTLIDNTSTPLSSVAAKTMGGRGGGVATRKAYTDPKTGANYVTTCAEVHTDDPWEDGGPVLDIPRLQHVIEHNGMITSVGHKSPLRPTREGSTRPQKQSMSDGEVVHRRKQLSSPKRVLYTRTPTDRSNTSSPVPDDEIPSSHRVTPVAFFDTMEKLVGSVPTGGAQFPTSFPRGAHSAEREPEGGRRGRNGEEEERDSYRQADHRRRADSDAEISMILSQLVATEEGAPRVSNGDSLAVPFSECYSLFVCLSILVQSRHEIIRSNADFYQLSTILNSQAAKQDLDKTLRIAHQLYQIYRKYQEMCFGTNRNYDNWLDDPEMENS